MFDAVIVGAGLVGASVALALKDSGLKLALLEAGLPEPLPRDESWDGRIYAISPGSVAYLKELNIWDALDHQRIAPVYRMQIFGDRDSQLTFDAYESGLPELAFILESRLLQDGLWQALNAQPNLEVICPARCKAMHFLDQGVQLELEDGVLIRTKLVIAADGANSWVREQAGIHAETHSYRQLGVVANFEVEHAHGNVARQWFRTDGVLAFLPMAGNRISIVWSAFESLADELMSLPLESFTERVREAANGCLGKMTLITPPAAFPLRLIRVAQLVKPRLALIGDAAHGVHPLAGQGVNLGFQDARQLAMVLKQRGRSDCGDGLLLRRYERARKEEVFAMQTVTDALQRLFNNDQHATGIIRNLGLTATEHLPWLKGKLVQHALGSTI